MNAIVEEFSLHMCSALNQSVRYHKECSLEFQVLSYVHLDVLRTGFSVDLETVFEEGVCGLFGRMQTESKNRIVCFVFFVCHDHEFNSHVGL